MNKFMIATTTAVALIAGVGAASAHASTPEDRPGLRSDAQSDARNEQQTAFHGTSKDAVPLGDLRSDISTNARSQSRPPDSRRRRH